MSVLLKSLWRLFAPPAEANGPVSGRHAFDDAGFLPLFVGGAGRSGTTVLQSLICTSTAAAPYVAECSYFADLLGILPLAMANFDNHNRYYFDSRGALMEYHCDILKAVLLDTWKRLGKSQILVLKHPPMTRNFHFLSGGIPRSRFIVAVRDPRDVIQSRIEVHFRITGQDPGHGIVSPSDLEDFCQEYISAYKAIVEHPELFEGRLLLVPYERLVAGLETARIASFLGVHDLDPDRVWKGAVTDIGEFKDDPWITPLYGQPVSKTSVGRHKRTMAPEMVNEVLDRCGPTATALGLEL